MIIDNSASSLTSPPTGESDAALFKKTQTEHNNVDDTRKKLRIGVMINSSQLSMWQYRLLAKIHNDEHSDLVLAIVRDEYQRTEKPASNSCYIDETVGRPQSNIAHKLFNRFQNWDRRNIINTPNPFAPNPLESIQLSELFKSDESSTMDFIHAIPYTTPSSDKVNAYDLETIRGYDLDVILRLGWRTLQGNILTVARCGIWSYQHGDTRTNRGGPPAVWEQYTNQESTGLTLQQLGENPDKSKLIARSFTATDKTSATRTVNKLYWRSADLIHRKLKQLQTQGAEKFYANLNSENLNDQLSEFYSQPLRSEKSMTLTQSFSYVSKCLFSHVKTALFNRMYDNKWVLYYYLSDELPTSLWKYTLLESPNDRYWADPHILLRNKIWYVFVEEFMYQTNRSRIAVMPINQFGEVGEVQTALETDYHLSYPSIFEHEGRTFMIPESSATRRIELWECEEFPSKWNLCKVLMDDVDAVDTTLHFKDDRWWMFTSMVETDGCANRDELFLFSSETLITDEWVPHPKSAIVSDVRCARSAGKIFEENGKLFRPAQDSSGASGHSTRLQEIVTLNLEDYEEREVSVIKPSWTPCVRGVQTIARAKGITMVDAKTMILRKDIDYG